jgi:hypothetical protein
VAFKVERLAWAVTRGAEQRQDLFDPKPRPAALPRLTHLRLEAWDGTVTLDSLPALVASLAS